MSKTDGFLKGLIVGAVAGLFLAPKSGKKLREDLMHKMDDAKDQAKEYSHVAKEKGAEFQHKAKDYSHVAKEKGTEFQHKAKDVAGNIKLTLKDTAQQMKSELKKASTNVKDEVEELKTDAEVIADEAIEEGQAVNENHHTPNHEDAVEPTPPTPGHHG